MEKYNKFFSEIKTVKQKQEQQKKRGLNDYNLLTTVLKEHDEVRLHSRMIASLLNPQGLHYQNTLFLDLFLDILEIKDFEINTQEVTVYNEYENIDIYITDGLKHIIIENKIYAGDQHKQIKRYINTIYKTNSQVEYEDILVIYLSIDRKSPSLYSLDNMKIKNQIICEEEKKMALYKAIHYKTTVLSWLKKCKYEVQNITNLNESIEQYIQVVKKITNQYKGKVMSIKDEIQKEKENYLIAKEIYHNLPSMRSDIFSKFIFEAIEKLQAILCEDWIVEKDGNLATPWGFPLRIYKKDWKNQDNYLLIGFEFQQKDYIDGGIGVVRKNNNINIENISKIFENELSHIKLDVNSSPWWLCNHNLKTTSKDIVEEILFNGFTSDKFVEIIMIYIEEFENKNGLMSKINNYLKQ